MLTFPNAGRHALRQGRISTPGQAYLLTTTTWGREPWFTDTETARATCRVIAARASWGDADLLAWVLMPDHWHGLIQLGHEPVDRVMARFKANTTRTLHNTGLARGPIWDRSFHDRALRADENLQHAARYLVANPVRAGLARTPLDYPYWNATWL